VYLAQTHGCLRGKADIRPFAAQRGEDAAGRIAVLHAAE